MIDIRIGDCLEVLATLPDNSVHCCVTSPPYWGLRDYGVSGQIGLESTPEEYVAKMVAVFSEVRRVLRWDGTCWVNLGDIFESKQLMGMPWRVAFALQADGWYLRQDIIWHKPNPMPESVTDRCTKSHEYVFLLAKSERYFYDAEAIQEPSSQGTHPRGPGNVRPEKGAQAYLDGDERHRTKAGLLAYSRKLAAIRSGTKNNASFDDAMAVMPASRNKRSVWTVTSQPYREAHFATFPEALVKPCIMAGTSARGCCPRCWAPWEREVKSTKTFESGSGRSGNAIAGKQDLKASSTNSTPDIRMGPTITTRTIGWRPTCECSESDFHPEDFDPMPCTVLDPFGGSGTTGLVALELGRRAILIELNPDYAGMASRRCQVTRGLPL